MHVCTVQAGVALAVRHRGYILIKLLTTQSLLFKVRRRHHSWLLVIHSKLRDEMYPDHKISNKLGLLRSFSAVAIVTSFWEKNSSCLDLTFTPHSDTYVRRIWCRLGRRKNLRQSTVHSLINDTTPYSYSIRSKNVLRLVVRSALVIASMTLPAFPWANKRLRNKQSWNEYS